MAIGGPFLSSYLQQYLQSRQLGQQQQSAEAEDLLRAVRLKEFMRQRQEEQQGQQAFAQILATQASRRMAPVSPVSVSTAQAPEAPGAFAEAIPVEQPGGAMGQLIPAEAQRPPALQSVLQGVQPAQAARLLTNPALRQGLKTVEDAEEDRRKAEDKAQAEEFIKAAGVELKAGNYLGFADNYSAAMRRIGRHDEAGRWTERGLLLRKEEERNQKADAYTKRVAGAASKWDDDDSPEHWDALIGALASAEPGEQAALAQTIMGRWLTDRMKDKAVPLPVKMIDREYMRLQSEDLREGRKPDEAKNWAQAYQKFPAYAGRHFEWWMTQKGKIPEGLRKFLRLPDTELDKEVTKGVAGRALARLKVEFPALALDTPQGMKQYLTLLDEEQKRAETPAAKAVRELNEERLKILKEGNVGDISKMPDDKLTLLADRAMRVATGLEEAGNEESARQMSQLAAVYAKELNRRRGSPQAGAPGKGKASVKGIQIAPPPATPTPEAAVTEAKRLMATGKFTKQEAVQAMKSAGWPVE